MSRDQSGLGIADFLGIGSFVVVCVLAGFALGWWADSATGQTPVFSLLGLAVGVGVGVLGTWVRVRPLLAQGGSGEASAADDRRRPGSD